MDGQAFVEKWSTSSAAERANKDHFLLDLCEALGVEKPRPTTGDPEQDTYTFERDAMLLHEGQRTSAGKMDLYKQDHFILEAKQGSDQGSKKLGTAKRGTAAWNLAMHDAFGQAVGYARTLGKPPPFMRAGEARRFGFITTNSIWQSFSRGVVAGQTESGQLSLAFVVPDHPWVDSADGAAVRVAMSVASSGDHAGTLCRVVAEDEGQDEASEVSLTSSHGHINPNFSIGPNLADTAPLQASAGLGFRGITLVGDGFIIPCTSLLAKAGPVRTLVGARALLGTGTPRCVIDLFGYSEERARREFPQHFQRLYDSVRPYRLQQKRSSYALQWWIFAEPRSQFRRAADGLPSYIATVETSRHRWFTFVTGGALPEQTLIAIAASDPFILGVLSSLIHTSWAAGSGSRLGVGNDLRYTIARCFDTFPFPACDDASKDRIRRAGQGLDEHRNRQRRVHPDLTLTEIYNVLAKLRSGDPLTAKEKTIHDQGLVSVLRQLHDDLDAAVFDAYGWPRDLTDEQILERLVQLNAERAAEEARGLVRWLRPDFQSAGKARKPAQATLIGAEAPAAEAAAQAAQPWPKRLPDQIAAARALLAGGEALSVKAAARAFKRADRGALAASLDALVALGLAVAFDVGGERRWRAAGRVAA